MGDSRWCTYGLDGSEQPWVQASVIAKYALNPAEARALGMSLQDAADSADALRRDLLDEPDPPAAEKPAPRPQHGLVLIGSTADASHGGEVTLFVRDLSSEAVFKIQGVRV